jgi:CelD/BcsL family acetyltransferase involved in cellulose biosynthesis
VTANGAAVAGVPVLEIARRGHRRWVALPFSDHCALLGGGAAPGISTAVELERTRQGVESFEVRGPLAQFADCFPTVAGYRHRLALSRDEASMLSGMSRTHRASIRKGERLAVTVAVSTSLDDFYPLHVRTRQRLGVPVQPRRFFDLIHERVLALGAGFVLTAAIDGRVVASGVFFTHRDRVIFKYSASDDRSWESRPNHVLAWSAIRLAAERGFAELDWGRTDLENEGLRGYKKGFGSTEETLIYSTLGASSGARTPRLAQSALSTLIRHSPMWVCRFTGEALYRFAQ